MLSIIILTKNEEKDLPACLDSLSWCDDIHLLDSGSDDNTLSIAENKLVKTYFNPFHSFGQQRNWALENISVKYDWIMFLDADERSTDKFQEELLQTIQNADQEVAGYYCSWKMILDDVWLKRCDNYPKWQFRLLRKGRANFTDYGHGQKEGWVDGKLAYLKEPYLHYGFSKGWEQWINRHNKYSTLEAKDRVGKLPPLKNVFSSHSSTRNPALKAWLIKIPGWPLLRFFQAYIVKLGFLEGKPGFIYCVNMAYYEFLIKIKIRELKRNS